MNPVGMITKSITMNEIIDEGFETLINDKDSHVKILVDIDASLQ